MGAEREGHSMIATAGWEAGRSRNAADGLSFGGRRAPQAQAPQPTAEAADPPEKLPPLGLRAVYHNPILFADYSDPDVIRDGANYYLVASTFHFVPGIPILQSTDLVHWTIVGHVVDRLTMDPRYSMVGGNRYGKGVWAPSIRKHDGLYLRLLPHSE